MFRSGVDYLLWLSALIGLIDGDHIERSEFGLISKFPLKELFIVNMIGESFYLFPLRLLV